MKLVLILALKLVFNRLECLFKTGFELARVFFETGFETGLGSYGGGGALSPIQPRVNLTTTKLTSHTFLTSFREIKQFFLDMAL